jgi:hypothetical protein
LSLTQPGENSLSLFFEIVEGVSATTSSSLSSLPDSSNLRKLKKYEKTNLKRLGPNHFESTGSRPITDVEPG